MIVRICGNIGAGKTTLVKKLIKNIDCDWVKEPVDNNPLLKPFYSNPKKYAAAMQIYMIQDYYLKCKKCDGSLIVSDYGLTEAYSKVHYRNGTMQEYQYGLVSYLERILRPDDTIYMKLDTSPIECLRRIKKRGRACEKGIELRYLESLDVEINRFLSKMDSVFMIRRVEDVENVLRNKGIV